jgi:type VI secretion system secreted protein VgrG
MASVLGDAAIAAAAQPTVQLGTAASFAVLAGSTVTNTGPSSVEGSLGLAPGTAVTGFPPGHVSNGSTYKANAVALQAKADLTTGYLDAAGRTPFVVTGSDLGGMTLAPGVYRAPSSLGLTGSVTLNGHGSANAVFIFQAGSTLITASSSTVRLENGAQACNVFWQVGSSATLGSGSDFTGTIMALTSISLNTGVTVHGRVLAQNGAVTLQNDVIAPSNCSTAPVTPPKKPPTKKHHPKKPPTKKPTPTPVSKKPVGPGTPTPGSSATTPNGKIPIGAPQTGEGGATQSANAAQVGGGLTALLAALLVSGVAVRRRRSDLTRPLLDNGTDGQR